MPNVQDLQRGELSNTHRFPAMPIVPTISGNREGWHSCSSLRFNGHVIVQQKGTELLLFSRPRTHVERQRSTCDEHIARGQRFAFGKNWQRFLAVLNEKRIEAAERSLQGMLGIDSLKGKTFLDIGSGSGLFSLAAMRLGATRVLSFDFDVQSVACASELKRRYFPGSSAWTVVRGDILDEEFLHGLKTWDVVYSWGVLHHTGNMWRALANVDSLVKPGGFLFISIYNDQGRQSANWAMIKRVYNKGSIQRRLVLTIFLPYFALRGAVGDLLRRTNPIHRYRGGMRSRGMSPVHDWIDWLGGYPFEVARPEQIFVFYRERGYTLERLMLNRGRGCNEFVFRNA